MNVVPRFELTPHSVTRVQEISFISMQKKFNMREIIELEQIIF